MELRLVEILVNFRWWNRTGWKFLMRAPTSEPPVGIFQWDLGGEQDWLKIFLRLDSGTRLTKNFHWYHVIPELVENFWWEPWRQSYRLKFLVRSRWWTGLVENFPQISIVEQGWPKFSVRTLTSKTLVKIFTKISMVEQGWSKFFSEISMMNKTVENFRWELWHRDTGQIFQWGLDGETGLVEIFQ